MRIILGVGGGIAAYKAAELARLLIPSIIKLATETPQRNFRIVELGIGLLVFGGRV